MACAITEAGFDYKIIHGLDELFWNETGQVVDSDGRILECVWKTWAWETALEQIRQECEKDYEHSALQIRTGHSEYHDYVLCY
ncbi:hypothetical protein MASR2M36_36980 [Providencia sp.]